MKKFYSFFSFRDFLWVSQAFVRGKVLRQRAYLPQAKVFFCYLQENTSITRVVALRRWWGYRGSAARRNS